MSWRVLLMGLGWVVLASPLLYLAIRAWYVPRVSSRDAAHELERRWRQARAAGEPFEYRAGNQWPCGLVYAVWTLVCVACAAWLVRDDMCSGIGWMMLGVGLLALGTMLWILPPFPVDTIRIRDGQVRVRVRRTRTAPLDQVTGVTVGLENWNRLVRLDGTDLPSVPGGMLMKPPPVVAAELRTLLALERDEPMPDLAPQPLEPLNRTPRTRRQKVRDAVVYLALCAAGLGLAYWWWGTEGLVRLGTQLGLTAVVLVVLSLAARRLYRRSR